MTARKPVARKDAPADIAHLLDERDYLLRLVKELEWEAVRHLSDPAARELLRAARERAKGER